MSDLLAPGAELEHLSTGTRWAEGPVWLPGLRAVRWSDIPNDRIMQLDAASGETTVYRDGVEFTNGRTLDLDGTVVQCSHGLRRVERDADGVVTPLVDRWEGGRFNSPNDVVVASDGAVWFTDPPYGLSEVEGHPGEQEYGGCFVFRYEPSSGVATPVITDRIRPNGLAFSPDESLLYVSDTGWSDERGEPSRIHVYAVGDGTASAGREFVIPAGVPDGLRVDEAGRVWTSSGESVQVFSAEAEELLTIPVPERTSNVCFGGDDGRDLYITATTSLYRIRTAVTAAAAAPP